MIVNIIHDPNDEERSKLLKVEIATQGISSVQWNAIMTKPANVGIGKSHKQIVEHARKHGYPEVCIAEDDMWFPAIDGFKYFLKNKPEDFDIYLGGVYSTCDGWINVKEKQLKCFSGLHLYIIRERYYNTFLDIDENINLDYGLSLLGRSGKGKFMCCYPFACIQHETTRAVSGPLNNLEVIGRRKTYGINA